jgi:hypothetical protein
MPNPRPAFLGPCISNPLHLVFAVLPPAESLARKRSPNQVHVRDRGIRCLGIVVRCQSLLDRFVIDADPLSFSIDEADPVFAQATLTPHRRDRLVRALAALIESRFVDWGLGNYELIAPQLLPAAQGRPKGSGKRATES